VTHNKISDLLLERPGLQNTKILTRFNHTSTSINHQFFLISLLVKLADKVLARILQCKVKFRFPFLPSPFPFFLVSFRLYHFLKFKITISYDRDDFMHA